MKIYIILIAVFGLIGCGTVKKIFSKDPEYYEKKEEFRPPQPHEIIKNADGTYTVIIDESLNVKPEKEGVSITKWLCSLTFLVATCLVAWHVIRYIYTKELKKGYDR